MSVMTKGFGTAAFGGGAVMTKGFGGQRFILPDFTPELSRGEKIGPPIMVRNYEPITPPDEMRLKLLWLLLQIIARRYANGKRTL